MKEIEVTKDFKRKTTGAILSILLFMATYLLLFAFAVGLTVLCGYLGLMLIALKPNFVTLMLGLGVAAVGVLTLFFLVKFIFTKSSTDLSGYIEIDENDQPKLFAMIREVVQKAGTDFPKKVYLSSEVNASVFYSSSFWSMFLPVRKNLHIGLGLVNSVTTDELRSIIAHEFGHFSQRSMKVGSYVYNVNYIIHNMLYDNEGYNNFVDRLARINGWMSLPVIGSVKLVQAIQWVLKKVYRVVNLNYRALSREMEFHADEVAARIAGPTAIATSLPRLELAADAQAEVLSYYNIKVEEHLRPATIFPLHLFVMQQRAGRMEIPLSNGLPLITPEYNKRFNNTRLKFDDNWATHPSNEDRIARVQGLGLPERPVDHTHAMTLLENRLAVEEKVTYQLYSNVAWTRMVTLHPPENFKADFVAQEDKEALPKQFKGYYDTIMLPEMPRKNLQEAGTALQTDEDALFSPDKVQLVYEKTGLEQDLETLNAIVSGDYEVKGFGYNGRHYGAAEAAALAETVRDELEKKKNEFDENNNRIYSHYLALAQQAGADGEYLDRYDTYAQYIKEYDQRFEELDTMFKMCSFMSEVTPPETIEANLRRVYAHETSLKKTILELIEDKKNAPLLAPDDDAKLRTYALSEHVYFKGENYNKEAVDDLYQSLHLYNFVLNRLIFLHKKAFLDFQASLKPLTYAIQ